MRNAGNKSLLPLQGFADIIKKLGRNFKA